MVLQLCCALLLLAIVASPASAVPRASPGATAVHRSCWGDSVSAGVPDGWSASSTVQGAVTLSGCADVPRLVARLPAGTGLVHPGDRVMWAYTAPPGASISRLAAALEHLADSGPDRAAGGARLFIRVYREQLLDDIDHLLYDCSDFVNAQFVSRRCDGSADTLPFEQTIGARQLFVALECVGPQGTSCDIAGTLIARDLDVELSDDLPPTGELVDGTLLAGGSRWGEQTVRIRAADEGLGAWQARVSIGGVVVQDWTTVAERGGRCVPLDASSDRLIWRWPTPCATTPTETLLRFDVSQVPLGTHLARLELRDAAGNTREVDAQQVVIGPPQEQRTSPPVDQPPAAPAPPVLTPPQLVPPTGVRFTGRRSTTKRVKAGGRVVFAGRLVDASGQPVAGHTVHVTSALRMKGARSASSTSATTGADGRFALRTRADASRDYLLTYRTASGAILATQQLRVLVKAAVRFTAPRSVRAGVRSRFSGRVSVAKRAGDGVPVRVEAYFHRRWRKVAVVRTDARGRFSWQHRFRYRGRFQMRARVVRHSRLPAEPATSRSVRFTVR